MQQDFRLSRKGNELKQKKKLGAYSALLPFLPLFPGALENSNKEEKINCTRRGVQRSAKTLKSQGKSYGLLPDLSTFTFACFPNVIGDDKIDNQEEKNSLEKKQSAMLA